jgi:hypothetical protein
VNRGFYISVRIPGHQKTKNVETMLGEKARAPFWR